MKLSFEKPMIMGILNITPDSFSDGGQFVDPQKALARIEEMKQEGATIIDIGAESTAQEESQVDDEEEWKRLEPVLSRIDYSETFVSVDTWKSEVAEKALQLGASMINDVTALRGDPEMLKVLLKFRPYVCLMYSSFTTPYAQKQTLHFDDVMKTIKFFLKKQTEQLTHFGFPKEKIMVDPGMGLFLSLDPSVSFKVIDQLEELTSLGFPILVGPSMKSFLGGEIKDRLSKTLEASKKCIDHGANILRVHHVKEHNNMIQSMGF